MACLTAWLKGEEYKTNKKGFMGKTWDSWVPGPEVWKEVYRVLKPGGHIIAFAGSRTHDLMSMALRLAGFECRDTVMWIYGSGFPKSLDVSKAIDKADSAGREVVGSLADIHPRYATPRNAIHEGGTATNEPPLLTAPSSYQWNGWGTALKPAFEPALLFRKPLVGTVVKNVLTYGTGALNIDGCRVELNGEKPFSYPNGPGGCKSGNFHYQGRAETPAEGSPLGRWPANVITDRSDEVVSLFTNSDESGSSVPNVKITGHGDGIGTSKSEYFGSERKKHDAGTGSAARFFYCAKASKRDKNEGIDASGKKLTNTHVTVKPTKLMQYLIRLVTPPNGVVLDPFNGSGSTGKAAMLEGMRYVGIELSQEYVDISNARIQHALDHSDMYQDDEDDPEDKPEKQDGELNQGSGLDLFQ